VPCYADCPAPPPHFGPVSLPQGSGR
jgi:hypothetical protein